MAKSTKPPKVFISYAWEDDVKSWARGFAKQLRKDGVEAVLDQWEAHYGDQLPEFMEKAVRESDFVVLVCTPKYKKKSDEREGGVGYEGHIITSEIFQNSNHRKFIPILRKGTWNSALPSWAAGKLSVDLSGESYNKENYQDLLRILHGKWYKPPPIGKPPDFPDEEEYDQIFENIARENETREEAEQEARENTKKEIAEKAKRKRKERQATQKAAIAKVFEKIASALKLTLNRVKPILRIAGLVGIVAILFWGGSLVLSNFDSPMLTTSTSRTMQPSATMRQVDTSTLQTEVHTSTETPTLTATPKFTPTPAFLQLIIAGNLIDLFPISNTNSENIKLLNSFNVGEQLIRWAISPDGSMLVTGHKKLDVVTRYVVRVWNTLNGDELYSFQLPYPTILNDIYLVEDNIYIAGCNKHSSSIANENSYSCTSGELLVFNARVEEISSQAKYPGKILGLSYDGKSVVVRSCVEGPGYICVQCQLVSSIVPCAFHEAQLWDTTGDLMMKYGMYDSVYQPAIFSPNNNLVVLDVNDPDPSLDNALLIYSQTNTELVETLGITGFVRTYEFSPDGTMIAAGMNDSIIQVWDMSSGETLFELKGHSADVYSLSFSDDGRYLISASANEIIFWDIVAKTQLKTIDAKETSFVHLVSDNTMIISLSRNNSLVNLWGVEYK